MKSTTIFLIALVAVSVTAISLRREEPVMAPVESGPVVDDVVGSDPTTWGPMGPPMKQEEKPVKEEKPVLEMPPLPELPPECKHMKSKDGQDEGVVICDFPKDQVPATKGGKDLKLKPKGDGKAELGPKDDFCGPMGCGSEGPMDGKKKHPLDGEMGPKDGDKMHFLDGGDMKGSMVEEKGHFLDGKLDEPMVGELKREYPELPMPAKDVPMPAKEDEHECGPMGCGDEKPAMGPMDAKMQLVKKGDEELEEAEVVEVKEKLQKAVEKLDKEEREEDDMKEPKNCQSRVDKEGNEKVVCAFKPEDMRKEVAKEQHKKEMKEKEEHEEKMRDLKDMAEEHMEAKRKEEAEKADFGKMKKGAEDKKAKEHMRREKEDLKMMKEEMKAMKEDMKKELKDEVKGELKKEVKDQVKHEVKEDMKKEVKKEMKEHGLKEGDLMEHADELEEVVDGPMD